MGWKRDLVTGLGAYLASYDVGVWQPDGSAYAAGVTAITVGLLPGEPEQVIAMTPYPVDANAGLANVVEGMNFRLRGTVDPRSVLDLEDAIFQVLHGAEHLQFGQCRINQALFYSAAPLGTDADDRYLRTCNYYFYAERPNIWRTE